MRRIQEASCICWRICGVTTSMAPPCGKGSFYPTEEKPFNTGRRGFRSAPATARGLTTDVRGALEDQGAPERCVVCYGPTASPMAWSWASFSPNVMLRFLMDVTEMFLPLRLLLAREPWQPEQDWV